MAIKDSEFAGQVIEGTDDVDSLTALHDNVTLIGLDGGNGLDTWDELFSAPGVDGTVMDGGAGIDILTGNGTNDTASYASAPAGVVVDLYVEDFLFGAAFDDGFGSLDALIGIENVTGSAYDDDLTGDDSANILAGGTGDDTLKGEGGNDVFKYSFTLDETPGEPQKTLFTDWLSEKYGKDFGDELPDFERGHHHHGHHQHHHGKHHHHHGKNDHHHGKNDHHHSHHHKHGGCDDHQPHEWGLSQSFFSKNYSEWLREVVVPDLEAQGLAHDTNGNGRIDVGLNQRDPDGTPRIEGLSDEQLSAIFGERDEVTLRHHHHGHDRWYSNSYTSSSGEGETTVSSGDGFDTIVDFGNGEDKLQFNFSADNNWADGQADPLAYLESFFNIDRDDFTSDGVTDTRLSVDTNDDGNMEWSVILASNDLTDGEVFAAVDMYVNDILIG